MVSFNSYPSDCAVDRQCSLTSDKQPDTTDYSFIRSSSTLNFLSSSVGSLFQSRGSSVYKLNYALDQWGMGVGFLAEAEVLFVRSRQALRPSIVYKVEWLNLLTPNVNYSGRTASLTSKVAFYIFIQQI